MDLDAWIEKLKRCEYLKEAEVKMLCDKALEILVEESNVQRVDSPVTICKSYTFLALCINEHPYREVAALLSAGLRALVILDCIVNWR